METVIPLVYRQGTDAYYSPDDMYSKILCRSTLVEYFKLPRLSQCKNIEVVINTKPPAGKPCYKIKFVDDFGSLTYRVSIPKDPSKQVWDAAGYDSAKCILQDKGLMGKFRYVYLRYS